MVRHDCHAGDAAPTYLPRLQEAIEDTREAGSERGIKAFQFSDSIVLARPFIKDVSVYHEFLITVSELQRALFYGGILARGGIAHGKHSDLNDVLFSQGLVSAYRLESEAAQFSRILISPDLAALFPLESAPIATDKDGLIFIDFLKDEPKEAVSEILSLVIPPMREQGSKVASKARWLVEYCHERIESLNFCPPEQTIFHS